jgi:hypothetical protein
MATTQTTLNGASFPPYLPFATFLSAVQNLRAHGLPDNVDKTAWPSKSWGDQVLIVNALKFLGLIDEAGNTQEDLKALVDTQENSDEEKRLLGDALRSKYSKAFELNLKTATIGQILEVIGQYGPTGETKKRGARFFLKAAHYCKIPLSTRLTSGLRSKQEATEGTVEEGNPAATTQSAQPTKHRRRKLAPPPPATRPPEITKGNAFLTITLRGMDGATLTLSGTFNAFELGGEERKLVYDITDLMKGYDQNKPASE